MSLARDIEKEPANWTSGTVGTGCLFRGNVGATLPCEGPEGPGSKVNSGYKYKDGEPELWFRRPTIKHSKTDS